MHACRHANIHTYMHAYIHTHIHTYIYTSMHACMHTYIHTYIHTYMHAYIHTYIMFYIPRVLQPGIFLCETILKCDWYIHRLNLSKAYVSVLSFQIDKTHLSSERLKSINPYRNEMRSKIPLRKFVINAR